MTRTVNDFGSLCLAEIDGREPPGTVARILAEATGKVAVDADDVAVSTLLKLAESLGAAGGLQAQIKTYASATKAAKAEQATLQKLRADTEADLAQAHADHRAALDAELKEHRKVLAAGQAELEAVKVQAGNLLAKAKQDSEAATKLKAKWERKMAAFESAA